MKRLITIIALSTGLAAGPAIADHEGSNILNRENVGGAIGAAIGGLAGNKIVDGKGQSAATAAGAVGGFLLGKNVAHNYRGGGRQPAQHSGYRRHAPSQKSYGHRGKSYRQHAPSRKSYDHRSTRLSRINDTFMARTTSNVRAGPGTGYSITDRLHRRESVHVVGKVRNRDWYMVKANGRRGFVYAPLLVQPRQDHRSYSYRDDHRGGGYRRDQSGRPWQR